MWRQVHSFTEWLLNKYLARYLSNVNLHQVHIGLTQGSVELENLKLREDALENFNLPFKIIDGTVGKLVLQIPMAGLSSGSLVLCLSDLNIRVSPYQGTEYDPVKEEEQRQAALNLKLEALEQQIYQRLYAQSKSWLSSFASSYFTSLIENLKLVINDVRFCYVDSVSVASMPFSLGVTIKHLATQPSPNRVGDFVLKEVQLEGFGIFWNFGNQTEGEDYEKDFVLEPISAKVELTQNKSKEPLNSLQTPRFAASLTLQTVQLTLSSRQYHMAARILNIIDWQRRVKLNREWHPVVPILGNARVWWQFAISAVKAPIARRMARERPNFVNARAKLLVQYVNLYAKMLSNNEIKDLIKGDIKPLEEGLTYEEVYLMRSLALNRVQRTSPAAKSPQSWGSWMRGWGYYTGPQIPSPVTPTEKSVGEEDAVDYSLFFDKDSVFGCVSANLLHGSVLLKEYEAAGTHKPLVQLTFVHLLLGAEYRMKTDTTIMSASLQDITLDNHCQRSSLFPHVVSRSQDEPTHVGSHDDSVESRDELSDPQSPAQEEPDPEGTSCNAEEGRSTGYVGADTPIPKKPVIDVYYELNPVLTSLDLLLRITTQPLDIVYNEDTIDRVTNFFALDPTIDFVVEAALARLGELRSKTKHQLRSTIDKIFSGKMRDFRRWDILCKIQAPLLIIPESFHNKNSSVVIVDLGQVVIDNMVDARQHSVKSENKSEGSDSDFSTPPSTPNNSIQDIPSYLNDQPRPLTSHLHSNSLRNICLLSPSYTENLSGLVEAPSKRHVIAETYVGTWKPSPVGQSTDSIYETFSLKLSDLKVHADSFEQMMLSQLRNEGQIMDRFSLDMKLERRLLFSLDPLHPNILISANVPKLEFRLDVKNMKCLLGCLRSIKSGEKPDRVAAPTVDDNLDNIPQSISASLQHSMKPETLMHAHLVDVKLQIEKISMTVQHGRELDLGLHIDDIELAYTKQPFDSELSLLISTLTICDRTQQFQDESYMMARSFPFRSEEQWDSPIEPECSEPDALIMVQILEIGPDYPSGTNKTPGTRCVDVKLNYFDLQPHHTTLAHLLGFAKRVSQGRKDARLSGGDVREETPLANGHEEWQYDVKMSVEHVSLGLLDPRATRLKIGSAAMLGVTLSVQRAGSGQETRLKVGRIQLRELGNEKSILGLGQMNPDAADHQALSITRTKAPGTLVVDAHVGSLQYFHSPAFTSAVISSVNSLLLLVEEQVSQISSKATQAANRVINYGVPGSERVSFSILIESPVVQLPRGQGSRDTLVGHLGNVTVRNEYCTVDQTDVHKIFVDVDNIHLYSAKLPASTGDMHIDNEPILHDTTFNVSVEQRKIRAKDRVTFQTNIRAEIPQGLKVTLSKKLYEQVIDTTQFATSLRAPAKRVRTSSSLVLEKEQHGTGYQPDLETLTLVKEVRSDFLLPEVLILLQGDLLDRSTPNLAKVKFEDFTVSWTKTLDSKDVYITLHKLSVIDMLEPAQSSAKYLFKSRHRARQHTNSGHGDSLFTPTRKRSDSQQLPMSPHKNESDMKALVSIRIVDNVADVEGEISGKCVVVDLNCVDMTVNLQTWVMLLDFMTFSSKSSEKVVRGSQAVSEFLHDMSDTSKDAQIHAAAEEGDGTTICVQMKEWNITLNKKEYPLALCQIEGVALKLSVNPNMIQCQGRMEGLSVKDLSPSAGLFESKFSVLGNEVLQFDFKKNTKEDRDLLREFDSSLKLHMGAIRYVHTKRFLAETLAFLDHFVVLDNSLQVNRNAVITGKYHEETPKHGHRILLDVQMNSPVVVVPVTPSSAHVLVGYPGNIEVSNSFRFATQEETLESTQESGRERSSRSCLLDCMDIQLRDMDVVSAVWDANQIKQATSLLYEKCLLTLSVRRNLDSSFNHSSPNVCVRGGLSTTGIRINETDLAKVKGFLGYNMSEDIGEFVISREHITDTVNVHKLDLDGVRCWLDVDIAIELDNISIELLHRKTDHSLAKFDLMSSTLAFQTYSNKHSVVKLTSRLLALQDTRPASGNAFPLVVTQREGFQPESLQLEINMRNTPEKKHWSFVLNKVKVHGVMDFLTLVKVFITSDVSSPERLLREHISGLPPIAQAPLKEIDKRDFDINLSIINTELVLPETCSQADSQAVVLQLTTLIVLRQRYHSRPALSITFEGVQMFSCSCGSPDTALTIMDVVGTMNVELRHDMGGNRSLRTGSLMDSTQASAVELQLESVTTKLSYQDALLFYNILDSVRRQLRAAVVIASHLDTPCNDVVPELLQEGLIESDAVADEPSDDQPSTQVNLVGIEVKCNSVSLCVIDDYGDRDIPLFSVLLAGFHLWWDLKGPSSLSNTARVDYYNSYVSGWEPLVEPWKVDVHYISCPEYSTLRVDAADTLDINLTHSFYKLALTTVDRLKPMLSGDVTVDRKVVRKPFVPFLIRNYTGFELKFAREIKTHPLNDPNPFSSARPGTVVSEWISVRHGDETMFTFEEAASRLHRHKLSHVLRSRSLRVSLGSWEEMSNISVDQVGHFFRDPKSMEPDYCDDGTIRVVFDLILEEGARKCITVHSALSLRNNTTIPLELLLQHPTSPSTPSQLLPLLSPDEVGHVPVDKVDWLIRVKPHGMGFDFSSCMKWDACPKKCDFYECTNSTMDKFYISTVIERGKFPAESYLPGHLIRFETPVVLYNSLPVELSYKILNGQQEDKGSGLVRSSDKLCLYNIDPHSDITCAFQLEGFTQQFYKVIFPYLGNTSSRKSFLARDERDRKLAIHVQCVVTDQFSWRIVPYVKYILLNLTQYPLLFSQQNVGEEAAGQYEENEAARSLHPFMFDFIQETHPRLMSVRIGKHYRKMRPIWSSGIDLAKPGGEFSVRCSLEDGRPGKVFDLSYECSVGSGSQSHITTVRIISRYHLENHSSHVLQYAQWYQSNNQSLMADSSFTDQEPIIEALPNSILPYTWPRNDLDQLLTVCIPDIVDCQWSGGFCISDPKSAVVSMRGSGGRKIFLQSTVVLQKSSYHVVFTDFNDLPNPYRIENHSRVCVEYRQETSSCPMSKLDPGSWVAYHWDEPALKPHALELQVTGGETQTVKVSPVPYTHLTALVYENAVYLTLVGTWKGGAPVMKDIPITYLEDKTFSSVRVDERLASSGSRLVLDVPQGVQVLVKQYNPHSITQLWQVTSTGQLMHFKTKLYLDIPGRPPNPGTYASLTLKPLDNTRHLTQTWHFQDNGNLTCLLPELAVSARNRLFQDGSDAVLDMVSKSPPEIRTHKRRPGCSAILIKTTLDGPTVVVQLLDAHEGERGVYKGEESNCPPPRPFQLQVKLAEGIGLSVMNHVPEEILYLSMKGISVDVEKAGDKLTCVLDIVALQADNQCREALVPVVLYPVVSKDDHTFNIRVIREMRGDGKMVVYPEIQALVANLSAQLDEVLLLKLFQFIGMAHNTQLKSSDPEPDAEFRLSNRRLAYNPVLVQSIVIHKTRINVSLIVAPVLEDDLKEIRSRLGIKSYLNFADVSFTLDKYQKSNQIAAPSTIQSNILQHYRACTAGQLVKIVLNSEMTGNMGGLFQDLMSGLSVGLDGDVGGMVKNMAHGVSDTASKLTSNASTVLTYMSADETFRADRDRHRAARYQSSSASIRAGLMGLRSGLIGGITSIPNQVSRGINEGGVAGGMTGLVKGIIGTVAKPAAGLFDFASGTTLAITQSTRSTESIGEVIRVRLPRCCTGETLSCFSNDTAQGMATMWSLNKKSKSERFVSWAVVNDTLKILISSDRVRLIEKASGNHVLKEIMLDNIGKCECVSKSSGKNTEHILIIEVHDNTPPDAAKLRPYSSPRLTCNTAKTALKISQDIQYAIGLRRKAAFFVIS